ncbi:MAG: hypothetical protein HFI09_02985 [Bacilli bacterium]|nr:hypothetical protein [Bacilli bacterium]
MKVLSYNIFGVKETLSPIPNWDERQVNLKRILRELLNDDDIKVCCFQEVNKNNINMLENVLNDKGYKILDKFPMKTSFYIQYNIIAIKNDENIEVNFIKCLPHGKDTEYKDVNNQVIDYNMSDYRTTVFINFKYENKKYLIGNVHTDYISTEGKIKGMVKSLNYMDTIDTDFKVIVGDMNMVSHMSEVYTILKNSENYTTLSRSKTFDILDNSWHGYGTKEQVNVDFAFIKENMTNHFDYRIIKQDNMIEEGSDHRPIIITID